MLPLRTKCPRTTGAVEDVEGKTGEGAKTGMKDAWQKTKQEILKGEERVRDTVILDLNFNKFSLCCHKFSANNGNRA